MEVKMTPINRLKPHPKNPRVHPDSAIDKLERSIKEFGWTNPVLVSADGYVLAGHARLKAARQAGLTDVPVIRLPLQGAKAEAYLIADNKLQEETGWDSKALKDIIGELDTGEFDLTLTGFNADEIEDLMTQSYGPAEIDDLLQELDLGQAVNKPIWATIRTSAENQEAIERALVALENCGIKVERSYET